MWKFAVLLIGLSGYCFAGPVGLKRNMPIVQQSDNTNDNMGAEAEPAVGSVDPSEIIIMSTLSLPSNATSIRADITDGFSCENKTYGYYADVDNDCQIFHVCLPVTYADGKENTFRWSFICPEETIFSQDSFTCMRPDDMTISCDESYQYYELNRNFGMMESQTDKEENNAAASENVSNNEMISEAEIEPQAKPVIQEQQEEEEKLDVKPIGQPRPQKPIRRKPAVTFATQKKPTTTSYPLRRMPQTQPTIPEKPLEHIPEDVKDSVKPLAVEEAEEIKPVVQKFSRRPVPVMSNTFKDKIQTSKPETMIGVRTELFNQKRKRPTVFNRKPIEAKGEDKEGEEEEQFKIKNRPEQQNFSTFESEMPDDSAKTQMADSEIQASEKEQTFVKSEIENSPPQAAAEDEMNEKPVQVLEAFEEIPAVISEVVETPKADEQENKNEETLPVEIGKEHAEDVLEIQTVNEIPEKNQIDEDEKVVAEEEIETPAESEPVEIVEEAQVVDETQKAEEETQMVEETQIAEETPKETPDVEVTQSLRSSAEVMQASEETQTAEEHQSLEETSAMQQSAVEEVQTADEVHSEEDTQVAEAAATVDKTQVPEEILESADEKQTIEAVPEATIEAQTADEEVPVAEAVQTAYETPQETEETEETHNSVEVSHNSEQIVEQQEEEQIDDIHGVEQNQKAPEDAQSVDEALNVKDPKPVGVDITLEDIEASQESDTLEEIKPAAVNESVEEIKGLDEINVPKPDEHEPIKSENSAEPAIFEENSEEAASLAPVQTIEEMESEKPVDAPETMQATEEMSQPDATIQQMYEDITDNKQSIGGFKPVDPVMAHEAEQLIADFINTLRMNDFTNETPGMHVKHQIDEEHGQLSQEGIAEVEESEKPAETVKTEDVKEKLNANEDENQETEPQISESQADSVENNEEEVQNIKDDEGHIQDIEETSNQLKSLEAQSTENVEETPKSEKVKSEFMNLPQEMFQIPVQVITTPLEVPREQIKETVYETEPAQISANSEEKAQDDMPAMGVEGYKPLSIDDIVELVKERLDHMPKNEMETPMQLEQVLSNSQADKAPKEEEEVKAGETEQHQKIAQSEEQQQQQEPQAEEDEESEEEIVMPIYQRFIEPLPQFNVNKTEVENEETDASEAHDQGKSSRSFSSRSMMKRLDPRKRRFLFKSESS